jgi:nitrate reductase NapE component
MNADKPEIRRKENGKKRLKGKEEGHRIITFAFPFYSSFLLPLLSVSICVHLRFIVALFCIVAFVFRALWVDMMMGNRFRTGLNKRF